MGVDEFDATHIQLEEELTADGAAVRARQQRLHLGILLIEDGCHECGLNARLPLVK